MLFIRLGAIGDVVRTLPALRLVRHRHPEAWIAWAVEGRALPIVQGHPDLDDVVPIDREAIAGDLSQPDTFFAGLVRAGKLRNELRRRRFTISLDFQGTFKSGLVAFAAGAPVRAGFERRAVKEGNHFFNNRYCSLPDRPVHRVERNLRLLEALGIAPEPPEGPVLLPIGEADREAAAGAISECGAADRPFVFVYPGSSRLQAYKRYPANRFGAVIHRLQEAGATVLVALGPGERDIEPELRASCGGALRVLPELPLLAMAEVIRRSALYLGNDTGPMHMAWLQGVPVVALFGPTDPALNAPWGEDHVVIDALASPQVRPGIARPTPAGARPRSDSVFESLDPGTVAEAVLRRLETTEDRRAPNVSQSARGERKNAAAVP